MRSQLQFFMVEDDEREFLAFAEQEVDSVETSKSSSLWLMVGDCPIQFCPSVSKNSVLNSGRIAIATTGTEQVYESSLKGERIFKRLRRWMRERYSNSLVCRNMNIPGSDMAVRDFWVGPFAEAWVLEDAGRVLKQPGVRNTEFYFANDN